MVELSRLIKPEYLKQRIVALDPGETTGACIFYQGEMIDATQLVTIPISTAIEAFDSYIVSTGVPDLVVYEDYRIYGWKADTHKWASLHTPKIIGVIETVCHFHDVPTEFRLAQQAKQFVTDARLEEWGLWLKGQQHARDAVRHAVYQLVHGKPQKAKNKLVKA